MLKHQKKNSTKPLEYPSTRVKVPQQLQVTKGRSNTKKYRTLPSKSALKQVEAHSRMNKSNEKQKNHVDSSISYKRTVVQIVLWVYYVEGLGHNLFSVGQFCDSDLEVAFRKFIWVKFLRSKDKTPTFVINLLKQLQVGLNKTVRFVRTDNGTAFVNKDLTDYYESVGITHEKTVPRTPRQNGVVKQRNRTLVKAARTMLIFSKAPLFLWAEAVATACYT
ncbi:integrase, catalytic region, zinc finger, CCHC-type containing protein [Tanacetum coccineum]